MGNVPWNKGKDGIYSDEARQLMSTKKKEYYETHPEAIERIRQLNLGKTTSEEVRQKIIAATTGIAKSEETKQKMSLAKTGKKRKPFSEEHRKKLAEASKQRWNKTNQNKTT